MKKKILNISIIFFASIALFFGCKEEEEVFPETRLFRPVLNEDLFSIDNTIIVDMGKLKRAQSYTIEVSRDTFATIDETIETDTNYVVIDDLLWNTIYQIRSTAHAADSKLDSKISELGAVRTQRFPSILSVPTIHDVTDVAARVYWTTAGAPVTGVKVFAINDLKLTNPLLEQEVTADDREAEEVIVYGLESDTRYQIAIYSDGVLRGWVNYTTKSAEPMTDNVIDLRGIGGDTTSILADTLPDVLDGSIILLERGKVYTTGGYEFDKSVIIRSAYGFTPQFAHIDCSSNFNLSDGSNVDKIEFFNVSFSGDFGGNYIFNIDKSGTIGEIKFDDCRIRLLRGITRIKGGTGTLNKYTMVNSLVDSINGYAVLTIDTDGWMAEDILLKNSTISKTQYFLVSRNNSNSIVIDGCTINEAPEKGRQMFRWRGGDGKNDVFNGVKITNTIWSHGWNMSGEEDYAVRGVEGMPNTNFEVINTYTTNQFLFSSNEIPGFPSAVYNGPATNLWIAPYTQFNFNIRDQGFAGKSSAGDPRWRVGL